MIYSQFNQSPLQRFSGGRGWLAFVIGLLVMTLVLIALPFVLLVGASSFIALSLFGRVFLKRQLAKFNRQQFEQQQSDFEPAQPQRFGQRETSFSPRPHQGRTFEHDPNG
ncbi:hypothetical protein [Shewanella waksmanii]|uniref:hypothetical protein n=1 Tax=Shewanella waksmanii TaxID=213783 RepID=UPI00048AD47E|nr:hypothetical protein [Shewanella waksmanii]